MSSDLLDLNQKICLETSAGLESTKFSTVLKTEHNGVIIFLTGSRKYGKTGGDLAVLLPHFLLALPVARLMTSNNRPVAWNSSCTQKPLLHCCAIKELPTRGHIILLSGFCNVFLKYLFSR